MLPLPDNTTATRKRIVRKYKLSEFPDPRPFLHIRCGQDILEKLDTAGIPGDKIRWTDTLCEGPLHRPRREEIRQRERAAYLSGRFRVPFTETFREIKGADWRVTQCERYDETLLWFEADLFDQVILVYLLDRLRPFAKETKISLICIGEFPGVRRFVGLGQLRPAQLAQLLPTRLPVTRRQFALGTEAWKAFTSRDPRNLLKLTRMRTKALPFLPQAVGRYLAEYPSVHNGLGQTEQWVLEAIEPGARTADSVFRRVHLREARPFMGDAMLYAVIRDLASGPAPALAGAAPRLERLDDRELRDCPIWLTDMGRRLLRNQTDWFRESASIRQFGGVTLRGPHARWRWDARTRSLRRFN
ncbi:MAG: DUF1835 domain-containing protein [Gemmatimonadales bacterium]|nr:DUF1835 domain-containing protein [Gemmatimonadales bacterium]